MTQPPAAPSPPRDDAEILTFPVSHPANAGYSDRVRYGVLGTLTVVDDDGGNRSLGGPARRRLLGALLSRHGHTVSIDKLLTDLWGDVPPATAEKTLQGHIVRLRDALGRDLDGSPIRTDPTGYRLEVAPSASTASVRASAASPRSSCSLSRSDTANGASGNST